MRLVPDRVPPYQPPSWAREIAQMRNMVRIPTRVSAYDPDQRPAPPENVTLTISVREVKTRLEFRGKVHCDFLTANTCEADIKKYIFQIRPCDGAGVALDGTNKRTLELPAKQAFDSDSELPHVIFQELEKPKKQHYQARARILDKDERFSNWSDWTSPQLPFQTALPKPPAPFNVILDFFSDVDKSRDEKWRTRVRWDEVTFWDVPGGDNEEDVARYAIRVQVSNDGAIGNDKMMHFIKEAKDNDADTTAQIVFHVRHRKWWYRASVRTIDKWNRRGDWSAWTAWQKPTQEAPPNPDDVTIHDNSLDSVVLDWDAPPEPANPDIIHIDVRYFQVQIASNPTFSPVHKFDREVHGERRRFHIKKADRGKTFYGRVRSMNADDDPGDWIAGRINGNSSPFADPDGVKIKSARYTMAWTLNGNAQAKLYKQMHPVPFDSKIIGAVIRAGDHDAATHPNDGCPTGSSLQANLRILNLADDTNRAVFDNDSRLKIPAGKHKDTLFLDDGDSAWAHQLVDKGESIGVKIATIGSSDPGSDIVVVATLAPYDN